MDNIQISDIITRVSDSYVYCGKYPRCSVKVALAAAIALRNGQHIYLHDLPKYLDIKEVSCKLTHLTRGASLRLKDSKTQGALTFTITQEERLVDGIAYF